MEGSKINLSRTRKEDLYGSTHSDVGDITVLQPETVSSIHEEFRPRLLDYQGGSGLELFQPRRVGVPAVKIERDERRVASGIMHSVHRSNEGFVLS